MTPEQERAKAILTSSLGKEMPSLAQNLTFETTVTAEIALGILGAVKQDVAAAMASQSADVSTFDTAVAEAKSFDVVRTDAASGFGVASPDRVGGQMNSEVAADAWKKAVTAANASLGIKE